MIDCERGRRIIPGLVCFLVIGVFIWSAEPGYLDAINQNAGDSYYNLLVQGFRHGQLNVYRDPPPGLASLANPYDPAANNSYVWQRPCLCHDMSYYHGKLYLYFGVTPALALFWPYVALTGHYLPQEDAVLIFFSLGFLASAGLIYGIWRRYYPEVSVSIVAAGLITIGLVTGILEVLASCDIYETAESCGFAFVMLALAGVWKALHEQRKTPWLVVASLAYGLAVGARPSLLFGAIILLAPSAQAWFATNAPGSRRRAILLLVPAIIPITLIGVGLALYNMLRFDNPFEFGWHYQLVGDIQNTKARQLSPAYLWFNIRFYFMEPIRWTSRFPFLLAPRLPSFPSGYGGVGAFYSGIFANYPISWLALAAPLALKGAAGKNFSPLRWFVAALFVLFLACAFAICLFLFGMSRYEPEFLPDLMLLAFIGILGLERALEPSPAWRWFARGMGCLLLGYSLFFNVMACVQSHAVQNNLSGNLFLNEGLTDRAIEYLGKAVALDPQSAPFHFALGNALVRSGQPDQAVFQYRKTLEIDPAFAEADNNIAYVLLQAGRVNDAIKYFQDAFKSQPNYQACYNLGFAFGKNHMASQAEACYRQAIQLQPRFLPAQISLAWMLATWPDASARNGSEAVALAENANQLAGGANPKILRTLAAADAEAGRFPEAVAAAGQAVALAPAGSSLAKELQVEIRLYQENSPLRTTGN